MAARRVSSRGRPVSEVTDVSEVVIVDAVRSAVGKRRGGLSQALSSDLFADVLAGAHRAGRASTRRWSVR